MSTRTKLLPVLAILIGVGCSDASTVSAPARSIEPASAAPADNLFGTPQKYVAIGTSVSMGFCV